MAEKITMAKKKIRRFAPILAIIGIVAIGFIYLKSRNGVTKVIVSKAEIKSIAKTISASGKTDVQDGYTVRALIGGSIKQINFKSGSLVKKDAVIIQMDPASLKAGLDTAYSTYLAAKATYDSYDQQIQAAKATESVRKLERDQVWRDYMGDKDESHKEAYKNAEALYQSAVSALKILEETKGSKQSLVGSTYSSYVSALYNYQNSTISSPARGYLALADIYQGSYVSAGDELFSITNSKSMVFKAEIDEADISHVKVGMKSTLSLDSYPSRQFEGTISNIDAKIITLTSGSTVAVADILFDTSELAPIIGLNGSADIEFDKVENMIAVPVDAVFDDLDKKYVYLVVGNRAIKREVEVSFEGDEYAGVVSGLNQGDTVIMDVASQTIKDGQKVVI